MSRRDEIMALLAATVEGTEYFICSECDGIADYRQDVSHQTDCLAGAIVTLLARGEALAAAAEKRLDGLHAITCAKSDDWPDEDTSKPCTCGEDDLAAALAAWKEG